MSRALTAALLLCFGAGFTQAQEVHDAATLGLSVGAAASDFSLPDQSGHSRTLNSLAGPRGLVLVFMRSADW